MNLAKWWQLQSKQLIIQLWKTLEHPIHHNQSYLIPTVNSQQINIQLDGLVPLIHIVSMASRLLRIFICANNLWHLDY